MASELPLQRNLQNKGIPFISHIASRKKLHRHWNSNMAFTRFLQIFGKNVGRSNLDSRLLSTSVRLIRW